MQGGTIIDASGLSAYDSENDGGNRLIARLFVLFQLMRPLQWVKNSIIYFALVFTVNEWKALEGFHQDLEMIALATGSFISFCLLSSAVYIINDITDASQDRIHPWKRYRPIASGRFSVIGAAVVGSILLILGLALAYILNLWLALVAITYVFLTIGYSFGLKRLPIIDVFTLSGGYVLRAAAGAVAISAPISPWLYIVTGLGAMLIGFGKRRAELELASSWEAAIQQRHVFRGYSIRLLDQLISVVATSTLVSYILYTFTANGVGANWMMISIPFVVYGLFRYLILIYHENVGERPGEELLMDRPLVMTVILWLTTVITILLFV